MKILRFLRLSASEILSSAKNHYNSLATEHIKMNSESTRQERIPPARGWSRTSAELLAYYESKLLGHLTVPYKSYQVSLQTDRPELKALSKEYINTLEICPEQKPNATSKQPNLVVVHGIRFNPSLPFHYPHLYDVTASKNSTPQDSLPASASS